MTDTAAELAFLICLLAYTLLVLAPALVLRVTDKSISVSIVIQSKKGLHAYTAENVEVQLGWIPVYGYVVFMLVQATIRVMWIVSPDAVWLGAWLGLGGSALAAAIATAVLDRAKRNTPATAATAASAFLGLLFSVFMVLLAVQLNG